MKKILYLFYIFCNLAFSQEQVGFQSDRFSGVHGILVDPTKQLDNPSIYDINIISNSLSIFNNFMYLKKASVLGLTKSDNKIVGADYSLENVNNSEVQAKNNNPYTVDYFRNLDNTRVYIENDLMLPSATFRFKKDYGTSVGLITRFRTNVSLKSDASIDYYNFSELNFLPFKVDKIKMSALAFAEIGINFARTIQETNDSKINAGITAKYLLGYGAVYLNSKKPALVKITNDSIYRITNYDIEIGQSIGYDKENDEYNIKPQGKGFAVDLGFSWQDKTFENNGHDFGFDVDYNWKIAASLLDLGYINFNKGEVYNFKNPNSTTFFSSDFDKVDNQNDIFEVLSNKVYGNPDQAKIGEKFTIGLPTALRFAYDKRFGEHIFIESQITQRIPIFENSILRPNRISISPRYENNYFGFGFPVTLFEYEKLGLGSYLRIGPFFIGTNNFIPLIFNQNELKTADIYFGFKVYSFGANEQDRHRRRTCNCN